MNWAASVSLNSPQEEYYYDYQSENSYSSILPYSYGSIQDGGSLHSSNVSIRIPQSIPENKQLLKFASSHNDIDEYGDEEPTEDEEDNDMHEMVDRFSEQRPIFTSSGVPKSSFNYNFIQEATKDPNETKFYISKLPFATQSREKQPLLSTSTNLPSVRPPVEDPEEASRVAKWEKHLAKFKRNAENDHSAEKSSLIVNQEEIKVAPANNSYWIRERERLRTLRDLARANGLEVSRGKARSLFRSRGGHPTASKWKILVIGCSVPLVIAIGILLCIYVFHWSPSSLAYGINGDGAAHFQQQAHITQAEAAHEALAPWSSHNLRTNKNN